MNEYKILNISPKATDQQIKTKFKKLCQIHHPDKGGNSDKFRTIVDAYNSLCIKRKMSTMSFDESGDQFFDRYFGNSKPPYRR